MNKLQLNEFGGLDIDSILLPAKDESNLGIRTKFDTPLTKVGKLAVIFPENNSTDKEWEYQHLYLTSNREKTGSYWVYDKFHNKVYFHGEECSKHTNMFPIEFTTDPKLIADGVPALPKFGLVWDDKYSVDKDVPFIEEFVRTYNEQKKEIPNPNNYPTKCYCGHTTWCECAPEQKGVDVEKLAETKIGNSFGGYIRTGMVEKWVEGYNQALQDNDRKFSLEDMVYFGQYCIKSFAIFRNQDSDYVKRVCLPEFIQSPTQQKGDTETLEMWCEMEEERIVNAFSGYVGGNGIWKIKLNSNGEPIIHFNKS